MSIRRYITIAVLAILLHQVDPSCFFPLHPGAIFADYPAINRLAWAEDENTVVPEILPPPREKQPGLEASPWPDAQPTLAPAVDEHKPLVPEAPVHQEEPAPEPSFVDRLHGRISLGLLSTAGWLDSFFADDRSVQEENQSYVRTRYDIFYEERTAHSYDPTVSVRLALPQLEKKANIVVSADPEETRRSTTAVAGNTSERTAPTEDRGVMTALHYFFRSTVRESIVVRTGALFSKGSPVLFLAPRYRSLMPLDSWDFRFTQVLLWRTDTAWKTDTILDLERPLLHDLFFRTSLGGVWTSNANGYLYSLSFSLRQPLNQTHALNYEWINSFQTRPIHELTEVVGIVRYRHSFWRDWLFFEVAPQYRFPRDRNFDATPGILFRFEMFFGRKA